MADKKAAEDARKAKEIVTKANDSMTVIQLNMFAKVNAPIEESFDAVNFIFSVMLFEGFDPVRTVQAVADLKIPMVIFYAMFVWGASRGYKVVAGSKAYNKTSLAGQSILDAMKKFLKPSGDSLGKDDLTISRLFAAFPMMAGKAMIYWGNDVVTDPPKGLPRYLRFTAGAELISRDDKATYNKFLEWAVSYDAVINKGKRQGKDQSAEDIRKVGTYAEMSWTSSYVKDDERIAICKHLQETEDAHDKNEKAPVIAMPNEGKLEALEKMKKK